jgi:hypothetical protein
MYFGIFLPLIGTVVFIFLALVSEAPLPRRIRRFVSLLALAGSLTLLYVIPKYYDKFMSSGNKEAADIFAVTAGFIICLGTTVPPQLLLKEDNPSTKTV